MRQKTKSSFDRAFSTRSYLALINIHISSSGVGCLAKKFIVHLSVLHKNSGDKIKECMQTKGGYILHIDGTCEGGSPHLISALDEISKFVLANIKIPTENADDIAGLLLKKVKKRFGKPVAVVSDLGKAMLGAISTVFPGILVFVCHFHFLRYLINDLQPLIEDIKVKEAATDFLQKNEVFEKLRSAMRIAGTDSKEGLNDEGENEDIKTIGQKTVNFRNWLVNDKIYKDAKAYHKMIEQIDKYRDKLFADPIIMKTPNGKISVQPQRTNNILEQFFRDFKRSHRPTSGNNSIAKKLQTMFADTTLVKNLDNPEYMNIILSGKTSLAECFAKTEHDIIQKEFKRASQPENKIPAKIRNFIKKEDVPKLFLNLRLN